MHYWRGPDAPSRRYRVAKSAALFVSRVLELYLLGIDENDLINEALFLSWHKAGHVSEDEPGLIFTIVRRKLFTKYKRGNKFRHQLKGRYLTTFDIIKHNHAQKLEHDFTLEDLLSGLQSKDETPAFEIRDYLCGLIRGLSLRHQKIIVLRSKGYTNVDIARRFGVSPPAISLQLKTIRSKIADRIHNGSES